MVCKAKHEEGQHMNRDRRNMAIAMGRYSKWTQKQDRDVREAISHALRLSGGSDCRFRSDEEILRAAQILHTLRTASFARPEEIPHGDLSPGRHAASCLLG